MNQSLAHITILVDDYDKAIQFYTQKLHFKLVEDKQLSSDKRWVLVKPEGKGDCCLLLARAANVNQLNHMGNQSGGRVFLFLYTDDFDRDYTNLIENNIQIEREPSDESYGRVLVFRDIFGNLWDLIQPKSNSS
jgi:catechol 2,3-dioxygenase-like lactoylglutathione lyase family enzyme